MVVVVAMEGKFKFRPPRIDLMGIPRDDDIGGSDVNADKVEQLNASRDGKHAHFIPQSSPKEVQTAQAFEKALNETDHGGQPRLKRSEHYISDSSTTMSHER